MKELTRQGEGVGHCASPWQPATAPLRRDRGPGSAALCSYPPGSLGAQWPRTVREREHLFLPLSPTRVLLFTDLLPWTEVAVDFSSYSFLRLRWQDKVLGGKPNSRLQGCHFLILTETNPKTEDAREEGKTQKACGSRSHGLLSLGSNTV